MRTIEKKISSSVASLILLFTCWQSLPAQIDKSVYFDFGDHYFYQAILTRVTTDSLHYDFVVKYANKGLSFKKIAIQGRSNFMAVVTVRVELRDTDGVARFSSEIRDSVSAKDYETSISRSHFHFVDFNVAVPRMKFFALIEFSQPGAVNGKRLSGIKVPNFELPTGETIGVPVATFIRGADIIPVVNSDERRYGFAFSSKEQILYVPIFNAHDYHLFTCTFTKSTTVRDLSDEWGSVAEIVLSTKPVVSRRLRFDTSSNVESLLVLDPAGDSTGYLAFTVPVDKVLPGLYTVVVAREGSASIATFEFECRWNEMPLSLRSTRYSIESMRPMVTDQQIDSITDGSEKSYRNELLKFWRRFDPTPRTNFNEAMEEYFRRVDFAFFNYQSIIEKDGSRTPRGRVYCLNGSPTKIERSSRSIQIPTESWIYENRVRKTFVFEMKDDGIYDLKSIVDLK